MIPSGLHAFWRVALLRISFCIYVLVWTEEKVLWLILQWWFLLFVTCSPNFITHFHLRDDAHVNIPVQTPMFCNRPTSPPSRKSTGTQRRNIFRKAHHCKSAPFRRNSYHSFLICRRSNCSEWILTVHSVSAQRRPQCRGHCWSTEVEASWNVMAHAQKPDFVFRRNGRVHLNRRGASVQSTTGSRGVRISGNNAGYTMFRGSVKSTGYPLHSPVSPSLPSRASPGAITFQLDSTYAIMPVALCKILLFTSLLNQKGDVEHSRYFLSSQKSMWTIRIPPTSYVVFHDAGYGFFRTGPSLVVLIFVWPSSVEVFWSLVLSGCSLLRYSVWWIIYFVLNVECRSGGQKISLKCICFRFFIISSKNKNSRYPSAAIPLLFHKVSATSATFILSRGKRPANVDSCSLISAIESQIIILRLHEGCSETGHILQEGNFLTIMFVACSGSRPVCGCV